MLTQPMANLQRIKLLGITYLVGKKHKLLFQDPLAELVWGLKSYKGAF